MFKAKFSFFELLGYSTAVGIANTYKPTQWQSWVSFFVLVFITIFIQLVADNYKGNKNKEAN